MTSIKITPKKAPELGDMVALLKNLTNSELNQLYSKSINSKMSPSERNNILTLARTIILLCNYEDRENEKDEIECMSDDQIYNLFKSKIEETIKK